MSFVAGTVRDKIENHLPIYRQAEIMAREGVPVNRSTLQSLFSGAAKQLEVLYERQNELIDQCEIIHGDETPTRLQEPGKGKCRKAYMWVQMTGLGPPLAKAVNYTWNQRTALEKFLSDSRLNIDNNPAENVIRPLALGRKNWLFAGNEAGGKHLAMLAGFAATCHKNNVNFRRWLEDILVKLSSTPISELDSLLPHQWHRAD